METGNAQYWFSTEEVNGLEINELKVIKRAVPETLKVSGSKAYLFFKRAFDIVAAIVVGLVLFLFMPIIAADYETICNIFFATDDVCEQLYVMNKLETLQLLSRGVARKAESNFVNTENNYYAQIFTKSVDLYFNLITEVDCDCMKEFLKNLYTGGYLKGLLVWIYNAKGDI